MTADMSLTCIGNRIRRSPSGLRGPARWGVPDSSLKSISDIDKATITGTISTAIANLESNGIIDRASALKELRQLSHVTGYFSNISDEDIKAAEDEPPPSPEVDPDEINAED